MILRTPRRRISPRTRRRYKAIREFFRRALGNTSQPDIKINSSIAVNVTDLKHKIVGLEHQLSEVSKHCRDLSCLENSFQKQSEYLTPAQTNHDLRPSKESTRESSERNSKSTTKVLYQNTNNNFKRSDDSDYVCCEHSNTDGRKDIIKVDIINPDKYFAHATKIKKKKSRLESRMDEVNDYDTYWTHKAHSAFQNINGYTPSSYHSLAPEYDDRRKDGEYPRLRRSKKHRKHREYSDLVDEQDARCKRYKEHDHRKSENFVLYPERKHKSKKNKQNSKLNEDFIADIIKRQYEPVKLFGRRQSEVSQFSAPICRDQEFSLQENIQEGEELCSCCFDERNRSRYRHARDLSDMRSICDTRLYSAKRNPRRRYQRQYAENYNDFTMYDFIPVKEKTSPKSRPKFAEDMIGHNCYKEVPPSPRTLRPRLNLKAQYNREYDEYTTQLQPNKRTDQKCYETPETDMASEIFVDRKHREKRKLQKSKKGQNQIPVQQEMSTMSNLQYPTYEHEGQIVNEKSLNKTQETVLSEKTDMALCEIKDILQNFLQEIKKDTTQSPVDKLDVLHNTSPKDSNGLKQESAKLNADIMTNSSFNVVGQCGLRTGFAPQYPNPYCYPVLPLCPMNCVPHGYVMPTPSFTCHACATSTKDSVCLGCSKTKNDIVDKDHAKSNETEELIKEIYKYVTQSPNSSRRKERSKNHEARRKELVTVLTSRSVGGSSRISRHDAQVGTPAMRCYSKSCEAIGSRMPSDTHQETTLSQSDTVLEKLSLEVTQSDSELSSDLVVKQKRNKSKFANVLRTLGLLKKNRKKEAIEELSESESSLEVDIKPRKPPYSQHVTNYMMHGQEYQRRPPSPPRPCPREGPYGYAPLPGYDTRGYPYPLHQPNEVFTPHRVYHDTIPENSTSHYRHGRHSASAPPYPDPYGAHCSHTPQIPLCLKEVEVKSAGTQSERKMSFFRKFATKPSPPAQTLLRSNQLTIKDTEAPKEKPTLFSGWKNMQAKGDGWKNFEKKNGGWKNFQKQDDSWKKLKSFGKTDTDPLKYSYKTQKQLAEGDVKMRNAMLKKLFYKKNPFSPRNLIVRTLLGKDKSSYGNPNVTFRPRMFF